jgi:hypothetical protein
MRHNWIFDVLSDLHAYASRNDLPGVARKVEEAIHEMRLEAGEAEDAPQSLTFRARRRMN